MVPFRDVHAHAVEKECQLGWSLNAWYKVYHAQGHYSTSIGCLGTEFLIGALRILRLHQGVAKS